MRLWLVSLFEPTPLDNTRPMRYMSIAAEATKKGYEVHHFACTFRHSTKVQRFNENYSIQVSEQYFVHYIHAPTYSRNISVKRFYSHWVFGRNLMKSIKNMPRPNGVVSAMPPVHSNYFLMNWCVKHHVPFLIDIIDPWPDVFKQYSTRGKAWLVSLFALLLSFRVKQIMRHSSGVFAISNEYIKWAITKGANPGSTLVSYPSVPFDEIQEKLSALGAQKPGDKLRLVYAGSLGVAYDLPTILLVAEELDKLYPGKTEFVICGAGHYETLIKQYQNRGQNLVFMGRLAYQELLAVYKSSHLGLAQYANGATQSVTYKLFDYLSAGLPILNSLPSEMAEIIENNNVGFNNAPTDHKALVRNIEKYIRQPSLIEVQKQNALQFTQRKGNNTSVYGEMIDYLTNYIRDDQSR